MKFNVLRYTSQVNALQNLCYHADADVYNVRTQFQFE